MVYFNFILNFISAVEDNFRDDIRELKKIDQNVLYDALKHERIQDHVDLDDDDKAFLNRMSKGISKLISLNPCIKFNGQKFGRKQWVEMVNRKCIR